MGTNPAVTGGPLWILVIVFAAAKVFGFSSMGWLWVFAPVWIVLAVALSAWVLAMILLGIAALLDR